MRPHGEPERLPPLKEVLSEIPEMRSPGHGPDPQRTSPHYAHGPPPFPEARGLAPSIPRPHFPTNVYPHDRSPPGFQERRIPSTSSASLSSSSRGSPALPSVHTLGAGAPEFDPREYRDPRSLPPLLANGVDRRGGPYAELSPGGINSRGQPVYSTAAPPSTDYRGPYVGPPPYPTGKGYDPGADYGDGKQKKRRGNLPKQVTDILRLWFQDHVAHPYPTEDEKQMLMSQTGLTISQISNWFINARRRSLPQMTKQAQAESELRESHAGRA